jgi:hypothetical protein
LIISNNLLGFFNKKWFSSHWRRFTQRVAKKVSLG